MDKPDMRNDEKGVSQVTTETYLLSYFHWVLFHLACPLTHSQGKLLANPAEAQEDCQSNHLICRLCLSERIS
jgi:hypothetical protein